MEGWEIIERRVSLLAGTVLVEGNGIACVARGGCIWAQLALEDAVWGKHNAHFRHIVISGGIQHTERSVKMLQGIMEHARMIGSSFSSVHGFQIKEKAGEGGRNLPPLRSSCRFSGTPSE